ncbi:hypothetical protein JM84_1249 [Dokdonia sp. Hel_I_63]|uniref:DUF6913 domain-containing protein n=1 Tax=Dokdonia sp. Hel_I_63 TaxID=1249996 RepID=UPI00119B1D7A|nr:hypothetical protein [Dokdonia sp. Hel_I_63]TVZ22355.1 hypothetical protein JM84_1249 [Dokdonia sp. Hel_I_63]
MFLNGLKAKSIHKQIDKQLRKRDYKPSGAKPVVVALLQDSTKPFDPVSLKKILKILNLSEKNLILLAYVKTMTKDQKELPSLFSEKQLGWKGVFKTAALENFKKQRFDILISYYHSDALALRAMTAMSNAVLKIGVSPEMESVNDLTIHVNDGQESIFIKEFEKYLKILKVIH